MDSVGIMLDVIGWVLGLAVFVAPFACPWPDGLESVAARLGFEHKAEAERFLADLKERMARFAPSQNVGSQPDPIALEVLAETEADAPPPMAPGFDPIAVQIARESQEEMMATLRGASAVNPDQAARAQRIGQQGALCEHVRHRLDLGERVGDDRERLVRRRQPPF